MKIDDALFYTCSLIEFIGRTQKLSRSDVVTYLGEDTIKKIYKFADVFHCEQITKVADEFINEKNLPMGNFDNVARCKYEVPDYWDIGDVYRRLIEDVAILSGKENIECLEEVYVSWISDAISNFNSDFFYQSREYIRACWEEGKVCD